MKFELNEIQAKIIILAEQNYSPRKGFFFDSYYKEINHIFDFERVYNEKITTS